VVEDVLEIQGLIARYAELVDDGDFEGLGELLSDAVLGPQGQSAEFGGRAGVIRMYSSTVRIYENGTPMTKHVTTNVQVEVDQSRESAVARSYFTVFQATRLLPLQPIVAGRYRDRFERRDGRWRFTERRFSTEMIGDVSQHILGEPERVLGA
jgi:3-phenylpropionate/cinnamic acid dioxygenase small subunit